VSAFIRTISKYIAEKEKEEEQQPRQQEQGDVMVKVDGCTP